MNADALIDQAITFYDDVGADDGHNTRRRSQLLLYLQHIYNYVWSFRPWEWTYTEATVIVTAVNGDFVALPADYLEFSHNGGLFDTARRIHMKEKPSHLIQKIRAESPTSGLSYAIFGVWAGKIQLPYTVTADTSFLAVYRKKAEVLTDAATELTIPDRYADTVILPGLVWRAQESKSDARETWAAQFREGMIQMCVQENPVKTGMRKMPLAVRGAW